jgi:hypothetical protein
MLELILIGLAWRNGWKGYALLPIVANAIPLLLRVTRAVFVFGVYKLGGIVPDVVQVGDMAQYIVLGVSLSFMLFPFWSFLMFGVLAVMATRRRVEDSFGELVVIGSWGIAFIMSLAIFILGARMEWMKG